jgi:hypothetical protein
MDWIKWFVPYIPTTVQGLFILVTMWMVKEALRTQREALKILDNHLAHISEHMGKTNLALELLLKDRIKQEVRK